MNTSTWTKAERELPPVVITSGNSQPSVKDDDVQFKDDMPNFDEMKYSDLLSFLGGKDLLTKDQSRKKEDLIKLAKETW